MISILCPTRKRPKEFRRMTDSARFTATGPIEIVAYVDEDDVSSIPTCSFLSHRPSPNFSCKVVVGPRIILTDTWNKCYKKATGDIMMQGNDDIIFRTPGWDRIVEDAFAEVPDRICMIHGDDGGTCHYGTFGPHPFVHRRWVDTLGYFIAPYFSSDYGDTWLNDIANMLKRRRYLPSVLIEHMHMAYGKAAIDQTTRDRLANGKRDDVDNLYLRLKPQRVADAERLRKLMFSTIDTSAWASSRKQRNIVLCPQCRSVETVFDNGYYTCNKCGVSWDD